MIETVALAGVGAGVGVGGYYGVRALTGPFLKAKEPLSLSYAQILERFARRDGITEKPAEYKLARTQPDGTRQVPITHLVRTTMGAPLPTPVPRYPSNDVRWLTQCMRNVRAALVNSGRGDEDARCAFCLSVIETGWGKTAWDHDYANVKASSAYYGNPDTIRAGFMWTKTPESAGVHVLIDRVRSLDCYHSFANMADFFHYQGRLFTQYPNFLGVRPGWRVGGLPGLYMGEDSLASGGYSGTGRLGRRADAYAYWRRMTRQMPNWEDRGAWNP